MITERDGRDDQEPPKIEVEGHVTWISRGGPPKTRRFSWSWFRRPRRSRGGKQ